MASEPPAENAPFPELRDSWRGFFKETKLFFTYRRCGACGQVYAPAYFAPEQLDELYRQMDDNTAGLPEALLAKTQRGYLGLLARKGLPPGGFLELGPDIGLFTREAMCVRAFDHYWMVEPNLAVHPVLQKLLSGRARTILSDSAAIASIPDASLSLIVAIHVLDHLAEPQTLLELLRRKLCPGGSILVVTHDQQSFLARLFGRRWPPYCLQHPQLYDATSLKKSLERAGFGQVRVRKTTNYFPVTYLLRHFLFAAGGGRIRLPELSWLNLGLRLGNIAAIATKSAVP
jgi:SAM-dependent methyltransferase